LSSIATNPGDACFRHIAIQKLQVPAVLVDIALKPDVAWLRLTALRNVSDQKLLFKIVLEAEDINEGQWNNSCGFKEYDTPIIRENGQFFGRFRRDAIRHVASSRLTNQDLLGKVAMEARKGDWQIRRDASSRLTDPGLLAKIGVWVRPDLTASLDDQVLLAKIAVEADDPDVRLAAAKKLTNQDVLGNIAAHEGDDRIRPLAIARLTDKSVLSRVGIWVRPELTDLVADQALLAQIAVKAGNPRVRSAAARRLTDQLLLATIALDDYNIEVRRAAISGLNDQNLLGKVAIEGVVRYPNYPSIALAAAQKISEQAVLEKVESTAKDWEVRGAVQKKLNEGKGLTNADPGAR
jgi:hypothetical protein